MDEGCDRVLEASASRNETKTNRTRMRKGRFGVRRSDLSRQTVLNGGVGNDFLLTG